MPLSISHYAEIKDKYCITYLGHCDEYVILLEYIRPFIEKQFPGIHIYLCCRDESVRLLKDTRNVLPYSVWQQHKRTFATNRVLGMDVDTNPIEMLLEESSISIPRIMPLPQMTQKTVICTKGLFPTKSLNSLQIEKLKNQYPEAVFDSDIEGANLVVGVEGKSLYRAAIAGIPTILVPTGNGTNLYKKLFGDSIYL